MHKCKTTSGSAGNAGRQSISTWPSDFVRRAIFANTTTETRQPSGATSGLGTCEMEESFGQNSNANNGILTERATRFYSVTITSVLNAAVSKSFVSTIKTGTAGMFCQNTKTTIRKTLRHCADDATSKRTAQNCSPPEPQSKESGGVICTSLNFALIAFAQTDATKAGDVALLAPLATEKP